MGVTAQRLKELGVADNVIAEPLGGAHRNPEKMAETLKTTLGQGIDELSRLHPGRAGKPPLRALNQV